MGALKFRLPPGEAIAKWPELKRAYVIGQDRTPTRTSVDVKSGLLICRRDSPESARVGVPWVVAGFGMPVVTTATLAERPQPYDLAVELARGKLNDVRNQAADWAQAGLRSPDELDHWLGLSQRAFAVAATSRDDPEASAAAAKSSLEAAFAAGRCLVETYTSQVIQRRRDHHPKLSTLLSCTLDGDPKDAAGPTLLLNSFNSARIRCDWGRLAPVEGKYRWEEADAQLHWCRRRRLIPIAGPILDLRPKSLPDWLWLWEGDFDQIQAMVVEVVRQAVTRYKGKVAFWHLANRVACGEMLGLNEEEQIRLTARIIQVAREADSNAQLVVDFDRPWAEWLSGGSFQLGPLHLADSLARADLGLGGIGLEIAPGFGPPGSLMRDLLEFSRLLDLFALVNLPLHVRFAFPSSAEPDPKAEEDVKVEPTHWPGKLDEAAQRDWAARWVALAVAKPFVRTVNWAQASDAVPHVYPNSGLIRRDGVAKPIVEWLQAFREENLG